MSSETDRPTADTPPQPDRPETAEQSNAAPDGAAETPASAAGSAIDTGEQRTGESDTPEPATAGSSGATTAGGETTAEAHAEHTADDSGPHLHPALIATAVALPVALIVAVLVIAAMSRTSTTREPLALGAVKAPAAASADCTKLLPALPDSLGDDYTKSELAQPAPPATMAWQHSDGGDPIVLRCGLDRPLEFNKASALQVVNGVSWFEVRDQTSGVTSGTWYAVDRGTYIAVTMPSKTGPSPLQEISNAIGKTLPATPLDPGPVPN